MTVGWCWTDKPICGPHRPCRTGLTVLVAVTCCYTSMLFFFLNDPPPPKISPLPFHAALPINFPKLANSVGGGGKGGDPPPHAAPQAVAVRPPHPRRAGTGVQLHRTRDDVHRRPEPVVALA